VTQPLAEMLYPIPGFPDYYVNGIGAIYSIKGPELRPLRIHQTGSGALFVRIYNKDGSRRAVRIRKLLRVHGIQLEDWMKDKLRKDNGLKWGNGHGETEDTVGNGS
jgi:hypothetical protein